MRSVFRWTAGICIGLLFFSSALSAVHAEESSANEITGAEEAGDPGGEFLAAVSGHMQELAGQLSEAGQVLLATPELIRALLTKARNPQALALGGEMAGKLLLVLLLGLAAAWLSGLILRSLRRRSGDSDSAPLLSRVLSLVGRTLLDTIPVAVFAVTTYLVLPLTDPRPETSLITTALVNAGILVRLILIITRLALVPGVSALRLVAMSEESVYYLYAWSKRLAVPGVFGYFILVAGRGIGMSADLYGFLMNLLGLIVAAMLIILVMQNKKNVAGWISRKSNDLPGAGDREKQTGFSGLALFRRRCAELWHVATILLVIVFFVIWALRIEGGPVFLFQGTIMTLLTIILAGLLARLAHHGVNQLFRISPELKTAYPGLEERANRYLPILRQALKSVVYVVALFAVAEAWGVGMLDWMFSPVGAMIAGKLSTLALLIGGSFLLWEVFNALIERALNNGGTIKVNTRRQTLLPLLKNVVRITLVVMVAMLVLSQFGINIGPLIAGAGVVGLAVGFGAQTLVRDIITGAFLLFENAIAVGDWVEAGGHIGTVERLTVRTLILRDLAGTVRVVPYGDVTTVTNYNRDYGYALVDAGVAYRESYGDVVQALQDVAVELRQDEIWGADITGDLEVFGMNNLGDSSVEIRVRMKTRPMRQFAVRRAFLERMKRIFDERDIEIPFPHQTIWFGTGKDGSAPPAYHSAVAGKAPKPSTDEPVDASSAPVKIASEAEASKEVMRESESEPDRNNNHL